jgi:PAS domain-containing protein
MDEAARLDEVQRYDVLDSGREPAFDRIVELAALACGAPMALVSIVDESRVWHKAAHGLQLDESARLGSFCAEALQAPRVLVVEDVAAHPRFSQYAASVGAAFYAGAPLTSPRGLALGSLCVLDRRPRTLSPDAERALLLLRDDAMRLLEDRRELIELRQAEAMRLEAVEALLATKTDLERRIELRTREVERAHENLRVVLERVEATARRLAEAQAVAHIGSWEWSVAENRVVWSSELHRIYGTKEGDGDGSYESFLSRVHPDDLEHTKAVIGDAYQNPKRFSYDHRIIRTDGATRMLHTYGEAITDAEGRLQRMVGSCWDTTEQWEAGRKEEWNRAVVAAILASADKGIIIVDDRQRLVAVNGRLSQLFEVPASLTAPGGDPAPLYAHIAARLDGFACDEQPLSVGGRAAGRVLIYSPV